MTETFNPEAMLKSAGQASEFLRSLANTDRLMLLCQLSQQELSVSELEARTGIRQPSLSQQLGILRRQALIRSRKEGKHVYYQLADPRVQRMLEQLYELFCSPDGAMND
ncbi:ArsR/SmtB family transcription factor [Marinobacter sp. X15-166B]|uniref:ArsR/SmtB family transcription factor n=1 Tax=Marinobacter sp. X15-166B TaxID=1897620 RepID=UPI00085CBBD9|nr:metalloregulator ArsR/SmtB family transcription factor [Marinobacter sp. X15-166B]OEY67640.1 transcriptional regulator [Marinobacter sp. X15-166B]